MAAPLTPLLAALTAWPAGTGSSRPARRATQAWADDAVLARFATPGEAAVAVAGPGGGRVLAALSRRTGDGWAATAALAGLAGWIAPIVARWTRAGMPRLELEAAEADLIAECLTQLSGLAPLTGRAFDAGTVTSPERIVQAGWHRVHNARRTERARAARHRPLPVTLKEIPGQSGSTVETVLAELTLAVTAGVIPVEGASAVAWQAAGWSTREAAARAGITPDVLRARRSRAVRRLAAEHRLSDACFADHQLVVA